jgi:nitrite reductase/ring-hydroxylating ferredoxin subunit/uncharacterized membrane protein
VIGLKIVDALAGQHWLDRASQVVQQGVQQLIKAGGPAAQRIEDTLHGTGLGHPLHPALTDVPIGAWTAALVLDVLDALGGDDSFAPGADAAIDVGLVAAVGTALTGLIDWQELDARPLRIGMVHGALNLSATVLYAAARVLRRRGARAAGRSLAMAGYAVLLAGAYLGGDLVYRDRIGVSHAEPVWTPMQFAPVLPEAELPEGALRRVTVGERQIVLARQNWQIYALAEHCTHLGGPLSEGTLEDGSIRCPWHGSRFALADGRPLAGPAALPQPCFETRVRDGQIEVRAA